MSTTKLAFSIKDKVFGDNLSPNNATLPIVSEFLQQVISFLKGSDRFDLNEIKTVIKSGSLLVQVENESGLLLNAYNDYMKLKESNDLNKIDFVRAKIIEKWQAETKLNELREYLLFKEKPELESIRISKETEFVEKRDVWVEEESYLYGRVFDMGGKTKPNVHIELETGNAIKIGADESELINDTINRLYKDQLVRVRVKRNIETNQIKDERLVSFEYYNPVFNEEDFEKIIRKARLAWKSVKNPTKWVEQLRGNYV